MSARRLRSRSSRCYRRLSIARWVGAYMAVVLTAGLAAPTLADVGPAGESVGTGPPAAPPGSGAFGTLVTLPDGTALLVGTLVQRYIPSTGSWAPAGALLGDGGVPTVLSNGKV